MFPPVAGIVLTALLGANLPIRGDVVQQALPDAVNETLLQAMPSPPDVVVRETYFGKITIDHRAHLGRRAACVACHGPGRVTKLEFTPRIAHERCIGCHKERQLGPVRCSGCHVKPPQPPPDSPDEAQVNARQRGAVAPGVTTPAANASSQPGAATAASSAPSPPLAAGGEAAAALREGARAAPVGLQRLLHVGWSAGAGNGPTLCFSSRQGVFTVTHSFDRVVGSGESRTLGLLGLGVSLPLRDKWRFEALGVGGFDLVDEPLIAWMPALGARAGVEWSARQWMFHNVQLSVTGVVDLSRKATGDIGGTVYATVSTGLGLPTR